ncbi:MAG: dihydropteroate synthase [Candidatus Krumholzibacteriia bacterium]
MSDAPGRAGGEPTVPFAAPGWDLGRVQVAPAGRPLVMGIVNLTPDSFWAGSRSGAVDEAVAFALRLEAEGADLLDLGAESSRPGAQAVGAAAEQDRLLPVLAALRTETALPLTVDTTRAATARLALDAGADAVNDITAGADPGMLPLVADRGCGLVLMHMQGTPRTMQDDPRYADVVAEVTGWLAARGRLAEEAGVPRARLCVDPGIGFGKTLAHNLALLRGLDRIAGGRPLLLGASRKGFIGALTGAPVPDRLPGSLAALAAAWRSRAAVVRVHDVAASVQFLDVLAHLA